MFHTTHCEILGDLLPQNVTIQHTLHAEPVLSFILRTFEDRPDLDLPSGNSSNQSASQGSIPATSSARTARSSSNSFNPRYQAQATSNSCYHDSCGFSSAPRFALWDQQSCSRALAQEQAQLQVLQASTPNYASGVENIAVARATEDDTDIATAQIAEEHELSRPRKYKISFRALDENEDSDIDDDNADSESSESSEIDADLAANCVSGGDSQLNAAALEANKKLQGSASYLIQYRRCVMLHLTVEQIQSYSQLLKTHRKYMLYVSGRLVPYYSVLDSGAHNVALSSGIKVPDRMQRQQGLSYTANNTFDYQRQNAEQELILVVDALYLIDPQLQHQPELLQETLMRHQVSAAISVPLLSQAQAQAHNHVVSANNAQASTASDYSAQVQAATAATAIPAAKAEACAQATATATATATADNAAYADNTTAIEDTTTREDVEVVTDLTSAQTVTAPAPQEQTQQLTLQAAYPLAQTTVSSILAVNLPEIPEELLRSHENCSQSGNMPLPHCSYTHYVRPAQSKSTNQSVKAHQEQAKASAPSVSATHTAKPMVGSTMPLANAEPSSQQQTQQLRNDELVASCVAPSLSIKVPQPNSTVLNKSTVINTAVDYARQISSRFTSPQASATPMKASEQPTQAQPRPTPQAQAQAQAQAQVNLQPQVPPQVQAQAQVQAQPLPAQGQPLPPQTQQGSFSAPQGMRSVTNNHAQMNNQSAQEVTPLPFPLGSSEPNNEPHPHRLLSPNIQLLHLRSHRCRHGHGRKCRRKRNHKGSLRRKHSHRPKHLHNRKYRHQCNHRCRCKHRHRLSRSLRLRQLHPRTLRSPPSSRSNSTCNAGLFTRSIHRATTAAMAAAAATATPIPVAQPTSVMPSMPMHPNHGVNQYPYPTALPHYPMWNEYYPKNNMRSRAMPQAVPPYLMHNLPPLTLEDKKPKYSVPRFILTALLVVIPLVLLVHVILYLIIEMQAVTQQM